MFSIPVSMYGLGTVLFLTIMDWVTLIFWTLDMGASLSTGVAMDGAYMMDYGFITKNYLKTWFFLDVIIVVPDWVMTLGLVSADKNSGNVSGLVRIFRIFRILRLLRLAKMKRIITRINDNIANEGVFVILSFVKTVILIFLINHFLGAFYYFIGDTLANYDSPNWIEQIGLANEPLSKRYLTSYKWSFAKFTMGTSIIESISSIEVVFEILTMAIGMTAFCVFTASIANWMMQAKHLQGEYPKQVWLLRRYFKQNHIGSELTERLHHYLQRYEKKMSARVNASRLTILDWLTESLRLELEYLVSYKKVTASPMLSYVESISMALMHQLCGTAGRLKSIVLGESIFTKGTIATSMCVIDTGTCSYWKKGLEKKVILEKEAYFCEGALWVNWTCKGDLTADSEGQLIYLDVKPFMEVMSTHAKMFATMSAYSELYAEFVSSIEDEEMVDLFMGHMELSTHGKNQRKHQLLLKQAYEKVKQRREEIFEATS